MTALNFTVRSTPEERYDENWRRRLTACMAEVRGVRVSDTGGGTFVATDGPGESDNDFEAEGIEPARVIVHLRRKGYVVQEWPT